MVSDLIVVAERHPSLPTATHHLMCRLLLDRQVLWVDAAAFRRESQAASAADRKDNPSTGFGFAGTVPFPVLSAEDLGVGVHPLAKLVSVRLLTRRIERAARMQRMRRPILWLASPWAAPLLDSFPRARVVYQVGKEPLPTAADSDERGACHARILARADLVLAPSRACAESLPSERTRLFAGGVDLELFQAAAQPARDLPAQGPVAGCHGRFDQGFDADLLKAVALRLPAWQFMLIGPVESDLSGLGALPNVRLTGGRAHDQLPRYLQSWQASLLLRSPRSPVRDAPNLRLLESLAAGLPVVTAGPLHPGPFDDLLVRAKSAEDVAGALSAAVDEPPQMRALRRQRLVGESWAARAAEVSALLDALDDGAGTLAAVGAGR